MKVSIKEAKKIRESLGFTHLIIFGKDKEGVQHIVTHGETVVDAKEAAGAGNELKKFLKWPEELCSAKPMERLCKNCSYFQQEKCVDGKCMYAPKSVRREREDRACGMFEPKE